MTQKKSPAGSNRKGLKKGIADRQDNIANPLVMQGLCAPCPYFRAVPLDSGRVRRVCRLTGERLPLVGNPLCGMQGESHE